MRHNFRCMIFSLLVGYGHYPSQAQDAVVGTPLPDAYAESVMLLMMSADGSEELSLRLARFPATSKGEVWLHIATKDGAWSLADDAFTLLGNLRTPVRESEATFAASTTNQSISFVTKNRRDGLLKGQVSGTPLVTPTRHPEMETGTIPANVDVTFLARSPGYRTENNRWELTGPVSGTVTVGNVVYRMASDCEQLK